MLCLLCYIPFLHAHIRPTFSSLPLSIICVFLNAVLTVLHSVFTRTHPPNSLHCTSTRLQCFEFWVCTTLQCCSLVLTDLVKDYFDFSLECYWGCCHWTQKFYWVIVEKLNPKILNFRLSKQGRSVGHVLKGETGDRPPFNSRWGAGYITWCWLGFDWIGILVVY